MQAKKYFLVFIMCISMGFLNKAKAQYYNNDTYREDSWRVQVGVEGIYRQNPPHNYGAGAAGLVSLEYYPNNYVGVTLTSGYYSLMGKKPEGSPVKTPNFTFIPLKVGVKAFIMPKWYIEGEFGGGYAKPKITPNNSFAKIIAPGFGYNNPDTGLDISLRYENINNQNHYISVIGLQVAYSFDITGGTGF